ncbi:uncharacterized protein TNCV_359221 [Trichonephila clavipes]|nr:uncharacterized protein TNCV_359221 [Trichonephila clavipes]
MGVSAQVSASGLTEAQNDECNVQQLFRVRPKVKVRDIWGISDLEGEKDFKDDHREEITDFGLSIPGFQECDAEKM